MAESDSEASSAEGTTEGQKFMNGEGVDGPMTGYGVCCTCIPAGNVGVVQWFGDFQGYTKPGIMFYCPPFQEVRVVSLAVKQIICETSCKTKDNVTMTVKTAVQFRINKAKIKSAVFDIMDPERQIHASVDNVVRSAVPSEDLDQVYANKDTLCSGILSYVSQQMAKWGFLILNVLVTDLSPDPQVLRSMNEINAARRQREAAVEQGEAHKILQVKAAEADAESKHLSGVGVARMRRAIANGFKESMSSMEQSGLSPQEATNFLVTTQYLDTLKDFATNPTPSTIMVPHGPGAVKDVKDQIRDGLASSSALTRPPQQAMMGSASSGAVRR